jgi:threonine dehydrogenase-like Zn-dependent dehydrogenase
MKALIVTDSLQLTMGDISAPTPGPFEALVKIRACGICSSTDSEIIRGTQPFLKNYPCLLGHEAVGEVVSVGSDVKRFHVGDVVTRPAGIWPGTTRDGLVSGWGGFTEFGIVRDRDALAAAGDPSAQSDYTALRQNVVPDGLGIEQAVLAIALAETLSWTRQLPDVAGKQICVAGTGIAGLGIVLWLKQAGAKRIIVLGRRAERLQLACTLGADHGVNIRSEDPSTAVKELTQGGADLFVEATGQSDQLRVGCSTLRNGGAVAVYGVPPNGHYELNWNWFPNDIRYLRPTTEEHLAYDDVATLILEKKIPTEMLMTHRWPLRDYGNAFSSVWRGEVVKGMLVI